MPSDEMTTPVMVPSIRELIGHGDGKGVELVTRVREHYRVRDVEPGLLPPRRPSVHPSRVGEAKTFAIALHSLIKKCRNAHGDGFSGTTTWPYTENRKGKGRMVSQPLLHGLDHTSSKLKVCNTCNKSVNTSKRGGPSHHPTRNWARPEQRRVQHGRKAKACRRRRRWPRASRQ